MCSGPTKFRSERTKFQAVKPQHNVAVSSAGNFVSELLNFGGTEHIGNYENPPKKMGKSQKYRGCVVV